MGGQSVGVVGAGAMGMGVVKRLIECGYAVHVRDIRREAEEEARAAGATVHPAPESLAAACDVVITLVVNDAQTEDVVLGGHGVAAALRPDAVLVVSSTLSPGFVEALGTELAARGLAMLDAPVSGGPARARDGGMSMMIAGPAATRERAAGVLADAAAKRFVIGERHGDAARMKLVNNMLAGVNLAAACEAMTLGIKLGLDPRTVHDVVNASSGGSWMFADRMPRVLSGDYATRAAVNILAKDLGLALDTAAAAESPAPIAAVARQAYLAAMALGHGAEDDSAIVKAHALLAGVRLPGASR